MAVAPPAAYARARATASSASAIAPADGERRLTSAMRWRPGAARASVTGRGSGAAATAARSAAAPSASSSGVADALAAPGLHLIAEVKRRSPSAGAIAAGGRRRRREARAYAAGGAAVISVLCEPHWFGGSVDDLRAVRAAGPCRCWPRSSSSTPGSSTCSAPPGADACCCSRVLHPATRLARLVAQARDLGLEPLVEAHDERELEAALATEARLIGINNRDLGPSRSTLSGRIACGTLVPDDRLVDRRVGRSRRRRRSRAGGRPGSTPRWSARR